MNSHKVVVEEHPAAGVVLVVLGKPIVHISAANANAVLVPVQSSQADKPPDADRA